MRVKAFVFDGIDNLDERIEQAINTWLLTQPNGSIHFSTQTQVSRREGEIVTTVIVWYSQ